MFASLVVVLPTKHEGGALIFRHEGQEIKFDSALTLAGEDEPAVAYAAFFSDVEHEVEEVRAGYRVTLTYNLYRTRIRRSGHTLPETVGGYVSKLADTFRTSFNDETFLPDGGLVGFGLRHDYPVFSGLNFGDVSLSELSASLKGSDALLAQVCKQLRLESKIMIVYNGDGEESYVLCDKPCSYDTLYEINLAYKLVSDNLGKELMSGPIEPRACISNDVDEVDSEHPEDESEQRTHVYWATTVSPYATETVCATYGNEPSIGVAYGRACLIVDVAPYGQRIKDTEPTQLKVAASET